MNLDASVGSGTIKLPLSEGFSGQVELVSGSGGVRLPNDYVHTKGQDVHGGSDSGTLACPDFDSPSDKLYIMC